MSELQYQVLGQLFVLAVLYLVSHLLRRGFTAYFESLVHHCRRIGLAFVALLRPPLDRGDVYDRELDLPGWLAERPAEPADPTVRDRR